MNPLVSVSVRPPELAATDGTYRFVAIGATSLILFVVFLLVSFTLFFRSAASCEFCRRSRGNAATKTRNGPISLGEESAIACWEYILFDYGHRR